jgi:DnaK suppressor protein
MSKITAKFIEAQKLKLLEMREQVLNKLAEKPEGVDESSEFMKEEGDHAQVLLSQQLSFRLRDKEIKKLREINAALHRIDEGTYGYCEESGDPIEKKRLEKQPWARLSIQSAEQMEREQGSRYRQI